MSDLIRFYGAKLSHKGTCRKCGKSRENGNHSKCDRWPSGHSLKNIAGVWYSGNSKETTIASFKEFVNTVVAGENDDTTIQFEIRVRQIFNESEDKEAES